MPNLSICIPTYNGAKYLDACLKSVLEQSYSDIEILAVDDGSSDDTVDILRRYAKVDRRIKIAINERNLGLVHNWNRCMNLANGRWIKFVFQDDLIESNCITEMLQVGSIEYPLVFCEREIIFDESTDLHTRTQYAKIPSLVDLFGSSTYVHSDLLIKTVLAEPRNFFGEPTAAMFHRSVFERFGYFNSHLVQFCDLEYWLRVGINTGIAFVPKRLASFRFHPTSTSAQNRSNANFRSDKLDRLIMLHEYARNPHFQPLRNAARRQIPPRRFDAELARKARWLKGLAEHMAVDAVAPDPRPLEAWRYVATQFPMLEESIQHMPLRLREKLDRHILWRFGMRSD